MPTDHDPSLFGFAPVESRRVVAGFEGGAITSNLFPSRRGMLTISSLIDAAWVILSYAA